MSITKRPQSLPTPPAQAVETFINAAPDGESHLASADQTRKNKVQIAFTIAPDLLASIDAIARKKGLSRAGTISLACADLIERLGN